MRWNSQCKHRNNAPNNIPTDRFIPAIFHPLHVLYTKKISLIWKGEWVLFWVFLPIAPRRSERSTRCMKLAKIGHIKWTKLIARIWGMNCNSCMLKWKNDTQITRLSGLDEFLRCGWIWRISPRTCNFQCLFSE